MRERRDPPGSFRFRVEIDGITLAAFAECAGLASETRVFEIREGGMNDRSHKRVGSTWHAPIALCRGITLSTDLWDWRQQVLEGAGESRRTGDVVLCDGRGDEIARWTFLAGWPSRWEGPRLSGSRSALAVERIEIVHEGLVLRH
jgi:phage tail-like protein